MNFQILRAAAQPCQDGVKAVGPWNDSRASARRRRALCGPSTRNRHRKPRASPLMKHFATLREATSLYLEEFPTRLDGHAIWSRCSAFLPIPELRTFLVGEVIRHWTPGVQRCPAERKPVVMRCG